MTSVYDKYVDTAFEYDDDSCLLQLDFAVEATDNDIIRIIDTLDEDEERIVICPELALRLTEIKGKEAPLNGIVPLFMDLDSSFYDGGDLWSDITCHNMTCDFKNFVFGSNTDQQIKFLRNYINSDFKTGDTEIDNVIKSIFEGEITDELTAERIKLIANLLIDYSFGNLAAYFEISNVNYNQRKIDIYPVSSYVGLVDCTVCRHQPEVMFKLIDLAHQIDPNVDTIIHEDLFFKAITDIELLKQLKRITISPSNNILVKSICGIDIPDGSSFKIDASIYKEKVLLEITGNASPLICSGSPFYVKIDGCPIHKPIVDFDSFIGTINPEETILQWINGEDVYMLIKCILATKFFKFGPRILNQAIKSKNISIIRLIKADPLNRFDLSIDVESRKILNDHPGLKKLIETVE